MPSVRLDVISIGAMSRNRLWGETQRVRTGHATTSLIRSGKKNIIVDPGLPPPAIKARLYERAGMQPEQIDTVFLTNLRPSHRGGLSVFEKAKVYVHEREQEAMIDRVRRQIEHSSRDEEERAMLAAELKLIESMKPAPDKLAEQVDLFPLFGYTPGTCGLLIAAATSTILVASDAVPSLDHFLAAQILPDSFDIEAAQESMREVYEIADLIVPGHDNIFPNPRAAM